MGIVESLPHWIEVEDVEYKNELTPGNYFKYYKRIMKAGNACINDYFAHIFICCFDNSKELEEGWRKINNLVAVRVQSKESELIERSNFYICFFVKDEIDVHIRNMIESDSFSSKKYVYDGRGMNFNEYCMEVEKRIFSIDVNISNKSSLKLKKLELQNFRAYDGNMKMNLMDSRNLPASFIVVYAKNGVGKTSLFDGIEFALKGEVNRLKELKDKVEGPVYHNIKHERDKAYVRLELEDDSRIRRNVAKISKPYNGKNDCRANTPVEGKEIVNSNKQWEQIMLPHHKIDSFISAKKARDQYTEWIEHTEALSKEQKEFIDAHKSQIEIEKKIEKLNQEYLKLNESLEELKGKEEKIQNISKLINEFNENEQENKLVFHREASTEEAYNLLINEINIRKRKIVTEKIPTIRNNIQVANKVLSIGVEEYANKLNLLESTQKTLKDKENRINRRKDYEKLLRKKKRVEQELEKTKLDLIPLQKIMDYSVEKVLSSTKNYKDIEDKIPNLQKSIDKYQEKIKVVQEEISKRSLTIQKAKNQKAEKTIYSELSQIVQSYLDNNKELKVVESQIKESIRIQEELASKKKDEDQFYDRIKKLKISDKLEKFDLRLLDDAKGILDEELINTFTNIYSSYQGEKDILNKYQEQMKKIEESNVELDALLKKAREYVLNHQEIKECPVCHAPYGNWEKVFQKINSIQCDNSDVLKEQVKSSSEKIKQLSFEYQNAHQSYIEIKNNKLQVQKNNVVQIEEDLKKELGNYKNIENKQEGCISTKKTLSEKLEKKDVVLPEISLSGLEQWYNQYLEILEKEILNSEETIEKDKEQLLEITTYLKAAENEATDLNRIHNTILNDSELVGYIRFVLNQPENYDIVNAFQELKSQGINQQKEKDELTQQSIEYEDVSSIDLNSCTLERDQELKILKEIQSMKDESNIFSEVKNDIVDNCLITWNEELTKLLNKSELLEQISEESGAREYFRNYSCINKALIDIQSELNNASTDKDIAKEVFEAKKDVLEQALHQYFNQNCINEIFRKIDPHDIMKSVEYKLSFNEKDEPELFIQVKESIEDEENCFRPEWYFSTAQLNTVAFSSFFSRAIMTENMPISTIFIDDPIGNFDDMNILGFADLMRSLLECTNYQIILSTHDEKVFSILERKLNPQFYSSAFIRLSDSPLISWNR